MDDDATTEKMLAALDAAGELVLPVQGASMGTRWAAARGVKVVAVAKRPARWGDIVLYERFGRIYAHRLIFCVGSRCLTKGDARLAWDRPSINRNQIVAIAVGLLDENQVLKPLQRSVTWTIGQLFLALLALPFIHHRPRQK